MKTVSTRIRAVASWPVSRSLAMSRRICFIWISLLFLNNFMRGIVSFSRVLLQLETIDNNSHQNPKIKLLMLYMITATNDRNSYQNPKTQKQMSYTKTIASNKTRISALNKLAKFSISTWNSNSIQHINMEKKIQNN